MDLSLEKLEDRILFQKLANEEAKHKLYFEKFIQSSAIAGAGMALSAKHGRYQSYNAIQREKERREQKKELLSDISKLKEEIKALQEQEVNSPKDLTPRKDPML